jgi:hypothetical protein
LEEAQYYLMLEGQTVGPYDRRTVIGMRAKNTLAAESVLIDSLGRRTTVDELMRKPRDDFALSGTFSIVKARYDAEIVECARSGPLPRYEGGIEVRVQPDIVRIAGRLRGRDDRVKIPLAYVAHVRARGDLADLWFRAEGGQLQAVTLRMPSPEAAKDLVSWLPDAKPPTASVLAGARAPVPFGVIAGVAGAVFAIVAVVLVLVVVLVLKR